MQINHHFEVFVRGNEQAEFQTVPEVLMKGKYLCEDIIITNIDCGQTKQLLAFCLPLENI